MLPECPICGGEIAPESLRDNLSREEFAISGMCQRCQDDVFSELDDDFYDDELGDDDDEPAWPEVNDV